MGHARLGGEYGALLNQRDEARDAIVALIAHCDRADLALQEVSHPDGITDHPMTSGWQKVGSASQVLAIYSLLFPIAIILIVLVFGAIQLVSYFVGRHYRPDWDGLLAIWPYVLALLVLALGMYVLRRLALARLAVDASVRISGRVLDEVLRELRELQDEVGEARRSATDLAVSLLYQGEDSDGVRTKAGEASARVGDAGRNAYFLAACRDILFAQRLVSRGRARLVPMKSTAVGLRQESACLQSATQPDSDSPGGEPDDMREVWVRCRSLVEDAEENLRDYRWNRLLAMGGFLWTALVAWVTWAATR